MANEHGPDFNWLKQEMDSGRKLNSSGGDSSTSLAEGPPPREEDSPLSDEPVESAETTESAPDRSPPSAQEAAADEEPSEIPEVPETILDELPQLPAAVPNASDGSTVVLTGPLFAGEKESPEASPVSESEESADVPATEETSEEQRSADDPAVPPEPEAASPAEPPPSTEPALEAAEAAPAAFNPFLPSSEPESATPPALATESGQTGGEPVTESSPVFPTPVFAKSASAAPPSPAEPATKQEPVTQTAPADEPTDSPPARPAKAAAASAQETTASKQNLILIGLASYASAVTLALLLMLMRGGPSAKPHHLESLPDVAPEPADSLSYVPVHAELALGHTLKIGEKQRFGNIVVEPLKIVREPIEFVHYSGDPTRKREPTAPVWKLWLRFTNVSDKQEIAPLDRNLLLRWVIRKDTNREYSNNYIAKQGAGKDSQVINCYRLSPTSDWDIKDQQLGTVLQPGESLETFIPTTVEELDLLSGDLVWRFQMRKGYGPSGHGVTTMVEVPFNTANIVAARNG